MATPFWDIPVQEYDCSLLKPQGVNKPPSTTLGHTLTVAMVDTEHDLVLNLDILLYRNKKDLEYEWEETLWGTPISTYREPMRGWLIDFVMHNEDALEKCAKAATQYAMDNGVLTKDANGDWLITEDGVDQVEDGARYMVDDSGRTYEELGVREYIENCLQTSLHPISLYTVNLGVNVYMRDSHYGLSMDVEVFCDDDGTLYKTIRRDPANKSWFDEFLSDREATEWVREQAVAYAQEHGYFAQKEDGTWLFDEYGRADYLVY